MTLVSVVIPNYNYGKALELCLRSIQAQTYPELEILLVDDCSTDNSREVARSLGIRVLQTPVNSGVAAARNLGAAHANGSILMFIDSDVAIRPDAIANAVALLDSDPRLGAVCGNYDPEPLIRDSLIEEYRSLQQYYWLAADEGRITTLYTAILAIRAEVFAQIGPFSASLRYTEDADYGRRLSRHHEILLSPAVRGRHDHDDSLRVLVRKVFHRSRLHVPFVGMRGDVQPRGRAGSNRIVGAMTAAAATASLPLPFVFGAAWTLMPLLLIGVFLASEPGIYRFVRSQKGTAFLPYFAAIYFLVNLVIITGLTVGVGQWLTSRRFRRVYA